MKFMNLVKSPLNFLQLRSHSAISNRLIERTVNLPFKKTRFNVVFCSYLSLSVQTLYGVPPSIRLCAAYATMRLVVNLIAECDNFFVQVCLLNDTGGPFDDARRLQ